MRKFHIALLIIFFSLISTSCAGGTGSGNSGGDIGNNPNNNQGSSNGEEFLTCIATDDNAYYENWVNSLTENYNGKFCSFYDRYSFKTKNRITVHCPKGIYAEVSLIDKEQNILFTAIPNANGICYLFPKDDQSFHDVQVKYYDINNSSVVNYYSVQDELIIDNIETTPVVKDAIDLMFVVDTTVSMNEELKFLQDNLSSIVNRVKISNNGVLIRISLLLYKDLDDNYITLYSKFTSDVDFQSDFLSDMLAYGGGDFEEAVDIAMLEASTKAWSGTNSTKVVVHIADAPCHDSDIVKWNYAVNEFSKKGIKLITVASTGINTKTEYLFRSATILTGGTYVYITNDPQIGSEYYDGNDSSSINQEYLDNCLVRLINYYHVGDF